MGKTPILQLETSNSTTDASQKFLTYRMNQNGDINSNMTKIDSWADTVNKKVKELQDRVSTVLLNANWVSLGYYEATTLDVTELKANMLFTIRLNKDNDGTTTIKVNGLTTKSLLKYDSSGALVNLMSGDLKKNKEYQFRYDGTSFVWQSGVSGDQVNVSGVNGDIVIISADNTVEDSGIKAEQINTNKDTIGNKESLKTTEKTNLVGAINEVVDSVGSEVLTTISQTVKGAINEVDSKVAKDIAYDPLGTELIATNVGDAINEVESKRLILSEDIGNKSNLQTDDKTNLVAAVNEVKAQSNEIATVELPKKVDKSQLGTIASQTYEEGVFTPTLRFGGVSTGISYTRQSARYTRSGNKVYVVIDIILLNKGSSTGVISITGLPFVGKTGPPNTTLFNTVVTMGTFSEDAKIISMGTGSGRTDITSLVVSKTGVLSSLTHDAFSATSQLIISGTYDI